MDERVGIAVVGASGRMGRMLIQAVEEEPRARLTGVTERPGHDWIGRDLGACLGTGETGVRVSDDALEVFAVSQAVLDFTTPAATMAHAVLAAQARLTHVIGTTGLERADIERLAAAARHAVIVRAGNMSVGVNLLTVLARRVATALGADYDVEIVEMHHRHKVDAPSGTALMLGDAVAAGRRVNLADVRESGRDGATGPRGEGAIGFASLRGGSVPGDHAVHFLSDNERIALSHLAENRMIFAKGAVKAALWLIGKPAGRYTMPEVLGL